MDQKPKSCERSSTGCFFLLVPPVTQKTHFFSKSTLQHFVKIGSSCKTNLDMNDEPIFTKCGRELYEKKCPKTAQGGPVKKNTLYVQVHLFLFFLWQIKQGGKC